ncbi:MAG: hypothetical protein ACOYD9_08545, partial [Pyramidobacter sp.]
MQSLPEPERETLGQALGLHKTSTEEYLLHAKDYEKAAREHKGLNNAVAMDMRAGALGITARERTEAMEKIKALGTDPMEGNEPFAAEARAVRDDLVTTFVKGGQSDELARANAELMSHFWYNLARSAAMDETGHRREGAPGPKAFYDKLKIRFAEQENKKVPSSPKGEGTVYEQAVRAGLNLDERVPVVDLTQIEPSAKGLGWRDLLQNLRGQLGQGSSISRDGLALLNLPNNAKRLQHVAYSGAPLRSQDRTARNAAVLSLSELMKNAVFVESYPNTKKNKKPGVLNYHRFYVPVALHNGIVTVRIVAEENKLSDGLTPINVNVYDVVIDKRTSRKQPTTTSASDTGNPFSEITIRDMLRGVKGMDGEIYAQPMNAGVDLNQEVTGVIVTPTMDEEQASRIKGGEDKKAFVNRIAGNYVNQDTGWTLELTKSGIRHAINSAFRPDNAISFGKWMQILQGLPQFLQYAKLVESHADNKSAPNVEKIHRFYVPARLFGNDEFTYTVMITVKEENKRMRAQLENIYETHDARAVKKYPTVKSTHNDSTRNRQELQPSDIFKTILRDVLDNVKDNDGNPYFQPGEQASLRGSVEFRGDKSLITLFKAADQSTFVHEMGHVMLENLLRLGRGDDAPPMVAKDLDVALDFLNMKDFDFDHVETPAQRKRLTDAQERFARAFERYLMEGRAPSKGLKRVFARMKRWMLSIYHNVRRLDVELSPQVRDLFARLLAGPVAEEGGWMTLADLHDDAAATKACLAELNATGSEKLPRGERRKAFYAGKKLGVELQKERALALKERQRDRACLKKEV